MKHEFLLHTKKIASCLNKILLICLSLLLKGCIDTFEPGTLTFERLLVVEAMITDEVIQHEVLLSRTTPLENRELSPEEEAIVTVTDDLQNTFFFTEQNPGQYVSDIEFGAQPDRIYTLNINTIDGVSFVSDSASLTGFGQIDDVRAISTINDNGNEGVEIVVDGSGLTDDATFFRYEFDETYQIVSPFMPSIELILVSENPLILERRLIEDERGICYRSDSSNSILTASTLNFSENSITNFGVRFINIDDIKIRSRYSINVKQFVQSREAQNFYETLQDVSDIESLFSQTQPGFIQGNISSINNPNENVVGFFEVSSVSTERIFFNFDDIFPDEFRPAFINECIEMQFQPTDPNFIGLFRTGRFDYVGEDANTGAIFIAIDICVDCRTLGTNIVPDFWED